MFLIFYFIKSETSDSFVNHFNGHFAYLKTLDLSFKLIVQGGRIQPKFPVEKLLTETMECLKRT